MLNTVLAVIDHVVSSSERQDGERVFFNFIIHNHTLHLGVVQEPRVRQRRAKFRLDAVKAFILEHQLE